LAAALYNLAPVWGQNLILSGYSLLLDRERYGERFRGFKDLLAKTEWYSESELLAYQDERLRATTRQAYETVPFYRSRFDECKLTPSDICGVCDLPKIPLLT
jgi:phenylacetate-CoA ligase